MGLDGLDGVGKARLSAGPAFFEGLSSKDALLDRLDQRQLVVLESPGSVLEPEDLFDPPATTSWPTLKSMEGQQLEGLVIAVELEDLALNGNKETIDAQTVVYDDGHGVPEARGSTGLEDPQGRNSYDVQKHETLAMAMTTTTTTTIT